MPKNWTSIYRKYKGKWVALKDDEQTVIGSGSTMKATLAIAKKSGYEKPILFRVPIKVVPRIGETKL